MGQTIKTEKNELATKREQDAITAMPRQLRPSQCNARFLGDRPVQVDALITIIHGRTMHRPRTMALWLRQLSTRCVLLYSPKLQVSKPEQGTIAAMPRQRSVLCPEAHASSTFPSPTAKPYACALRAHPRSARLLVTV